MTIVTPYKKTSLGFFLFSLVSLMVGGVAFAGIIFYNELVDIRHNMGKISENVRRTEVENAELKSNLYAIIDPQNPEDFLREKGLTLEKNPLYAGHALSREISGL